MWISKKKEKRENSFFFVVNQEKKRRMEGKKKAEQINHLHEILHFSVSKTDKKEKSEKELKELERHFQDPNNREFLTKAFKTKTDVLKTYTDILNNKESTEEQVLDALKAIEQYGESHFSI